VVSASLVAWQAGTDGDTTLDAVVLPSAFAGVQFASGTCKQHVPSCCMGEAGRLHIFGSPVAVQLKWRRKGAAHLVESEGWQPCTSSPCLFG